ncbi:MAG: hypothetical protein JNN12_02805 [Bacteroidetes Order II. Incertae sedis bacterium]|nr:hypothetical protein [Bacteroidetes Order II. bacterium]
MIWGQLIATCTEEGYLDIRYHHLSTDGTLKTGICHSVPDILPDGRFCLKESWQWTSGNYRTGKSTIVEVSIQ